MEIKGGKEGKMEATIGEMDEYRRRRRWLRLTGGCKEGIEGVTARQRMKTERKEVGFQV